MGKTLVIAEKPSVAADLSRALGKFEKHAEYFENDKFVISSAVGHLLELIAPEGVEVKRGKWQLANLPVLPQDFDLQPVEKTESRLRVLRKLIKRKDVDDIINACDAGREGELIFRNIIRDSSTKKSISRLWLQSMTPQAIRDAFAQLRTDEEMQPLSDAATSRSESDWLIGINCTRALTAFNSKTGGFQKTTAGRVQTPTLAILVERELKIRAFKARTYFEVYGDFTVTKGDYRGRWFDPAFKKGAEEDTRAERIWEKEKAEAIVAKCLGKPGTIEEEKKPQTQASPLLYDLTTLQREANSRFGISASRTLQIAQSLYEKFKVLTYPRTDSRYLPEDYIGNAKGVLTNFADSTLARLGAKAVENGWVKPNKRIFNNAKVSDHFAIVPTGQDPKGLDDFQMKIYEMVARRFIAVFYPSAEFEITTRITTVESEKFRTDGKIIVKPGWLEVYGKQAVGDGDDDKVLVAITDAEKAHTRDLELKECETKPPARFNEATLLSAMEGAGKLIEDEELREAMSQRGLGTPATRASIIEGLLYEGYIERRQRDLIATSKGISLITLLRNLKAEVLTRPELTGDWEYKLREMEQGRMSRAEFMNEIRNLTVDIVEKVKGFGDKPIEGEFLTLDVVCPKCGGGPIREDFKTWSCVACAHRLWKTMAAREFEPEEVKTLLTERKVGPLEGFVSKMGRRFAATVVLDADHKATFDFAQDDAASAEPMDTTGKTPLGLCPVCKAGQVYELETNYACEKQPEKKCTFRTGKTILQRQIPVEQVVKLITTGKTDLLPKFISKKNKPFSAFLKLEPGGKVGFEFEPRKPRPPKAEKAKPEPSTP